MERALAGISDRQLNTPPAPGEWTVAEVMAHVIEIMSLWSGKCLLPVTQDVPVVARTADEVPLRTKAVQEHGKDDIATVLRRFKQASAQTLTNIHKLKDADLDRKGRRSDKEQTVRQMLTELVLNHVKEHVTTVQTNRTAVGG